MIYCFLKPSTLSLWIPCILSWESNQCLSFEPRVVCLDVKHLILFVFVPIVYWFISRPHHALVHATFSLWFKFYFSSWVLEIPLSFGAKQIFHHFYQKCITLLICLDNACCSHQFFSLSHISSTNYGAMTFSLYNENTLAQGFEPLVSILIIDPPFVIFILSSALGSYSYLSWSTTTYLQS